MTMAFIIPDKILETLICNTCHKYLSVKPVKVYPNRRIKCGRCSRSKKQGDGIISLYGLVANNCLFKCINRYDGCREILTYSQVRDHEKTCQSRSLRCPLCSGSEEITAFFLVKHFRDEHKSSVLDHPIFVVNFDSQSEISKLYMYVLEDNLFFVNFQYSVVENIMRLNISYNGDAKTAGNIHQKFFLLSDSKSFKFITKKRACTTFEADTFYSFSFAEADLEGMGKTVVVKFDLEVINSSLTMLPLKVNHSTNSGDALDTISIESLTLSDSGIVPAASFSPDVEPLTPRKIDIDHVFIRTFPNISLDNCGTALIHAKKTIFLHCFNCQEICWRGISRDLLVQQFYVNVTSRHSLCYYCFSYLKSKTKIKENEYVLSTLPLEALKIVKFFCRWQCGSSFVANEHVGHEESCTWQTHQECPIESCNFSGKLVDIWIHLRSTHDFDSCFYSNFYISSLFNRNIYVWVGNQFVLFETITYQTLSINTKVCRDDKTHAEVLLFDDKKVFLRSFKNSITLNKGDHWIKIMITNRRVP